MHATGMPETFSPPPTSKETASQRSRHASRHVRHARAVMHVGIANPRWRGKRSRHSLRMRNPQFYASGKRPITSWHGNAFCPIDVCVCEGWLWWGWRVGGLTVVSPHKESVLQSLAFPLLYVYVFMLYLWHVTVLWNAYLFGPKWSINYYYY